MHEGRTIANSTDATLSRDTGDCVRNFSPPGVRSTSYELKSKLTIGFITEQIAIVFERPIAHRRNRFAKQL